MPISMSAVLVAILLFLPGVNIIGWKDAKKEIDWGIPLLFAAGFTLALALDRSGVVYAMQVLIDHYLNSLSGFILPLILMILFVLIRMFFTNFTAMVASLMPVALSFASASSFNPVWLGMICVVASSAAYLFPSQSAGNMTTFATGYYKSGDMLMLGTCITLLLMVTTLIFAYIYWPLVGIPIY